MIDILASSWLASFFMMKVRERLVYLDWRAALQMM